MGATSHELDRRWAALAAVVLAVAGLWAYHGTFQSPFFFDDIPAIVDNSTLRPPWNWGRLLFPPSAEGNGVGGRPIVNLSFALNYAISGTDVGSYHALNLLIHVGVGWLLYCLLKRTFAGRTGLPTHALALGASALWLLHPLVTESVTCVVQRTESLMAVFYLATLACFVRGAQESSRLSLGLSVLFCFFGMATKETMVTAPVIVFLYDWVFLTGSPAAAWRRRRGVYLGLASSWILLGVLISESGGSRGSSAGFGLGITPWTYALTQCQAIVHYLRLSLWPSPLVVDYGTPLVTHLGAVAVRAVALLVLVGSSLYELSRKRFGPKALGFAGLSFFILLSPSSSVVPLVTQTIAEHRMYLPLAVLIATAVACAWTILAQLSESALAQRGFFAVIALLALLLGLATVSRNKDYQSVKGIWSDTVAKVPANARARTNLGELYYNDGQIEDAITSYEAAIASDSELPAAHYNLGVAFVKKGEFAKAQGQFEQTLALHTNTWVAAEAHRDLGTVLAREGQLDDAVPQFEAALQIRPDMAEAETGLATALLQLRHFDEAKDHYEHALSLDPRSAASLFNLANILAQEGDWDGAIRHYRAAVAVDPGYARAHCNLGGALAQTGNLKEAAREFREALRLSPDMTEARDNLARVEAYLGGSH